MPAAALADVHRLFLLFGGVATVTLVVRAFGARKKRNPSNLPLPPGPKPLPVVGNLKDIPQHDPWVGYNALTQQYGDMVYLNVLGQGVLIVGSQTRAVDLLVKRAVKWSSRPAPAMLELMDFEWSFGVMGYGQLWRDNRRTFHHFFTPSVLAQWHPIVSEERDVLFKALRENPKPNPQELFDHVHLLFGRAIMRIAYGFEDAPTNAALIHDAEVVLDGFGESSVPGKFLVNSFPILKHVPAWMPGAGFQTYMKDLAIKSRNICTPPLKLAKANLEKGLNRKYPSMAATLVDKMAQEEYANEAERARDEGIAEGVCASAYIAGSDTTVTGGIILLAALANNPDVQRRGQEEVDSVVGLDRLPVVEDRDSMPYVHAIVKEVQRWYTTVPLGTPHVNDEDDEYDGFFIPKDTFVFTNAWAIMHSEELFERPWEFLPDRYIGKDGRINKSVPDPEIGAFGYGRRICPGRHFSNDALFLYAASLLAVFNITPPRDEAGNTVPIKVEPNFVGNTANVKPHKFTCEFSIRSRGNLVH